MSSNWETICAEQRALELSRIPKEWRLPEALVAQCNETSTLNVMDVPRTCGLLNAKQLDITENYDATALLEKLASGEFTSLEVTTAFCIRAAIAQQLLSCLTEIMFDDALARAKYCDEYLATHKKTLGPFHGLPISIKDSFDVKGYTSTAGYIALLQRGPREQNSACAQILLDAGAVLYVKTNIPQTMMTADSHNNIYGRVLNPNRLCQTAGGSSGGEGALIAFRGSVLGVGTDIAGSIRIPAFANGTMGLRPTALRVPYKGQAGGRRVGHPGVLSTAGPLAHSLRDIDLFMKVVTHGACWQYDEGALNVPWRAAEKKKILRIGTITEDERYPLHPTILRALETAKAALVAKGHTIVPLDDKLPESLYQTAMTGFQYFAIDPTAAITELIKQGGEPPVPSLLSTVHPDIQALVPDLELFFQLNRSRKEHADGWRRMLVENNVDVVLMPIYQGTAPRHDEFGLPVYTTVVNVLDFPSIVLPYQKGNKELDAKYIRNVTYSPAYEPDRSEGMPASIQFVGRHHLDDEQLVQDVITIAEDLGVN